MVEIKPGDFVVDIGRWTFDVRKVSKVTEKCFWFIDMGRRNKEVRRDSGGVVFAGPEIIARRLCEQLKSSDALDTQDRERSSERRKKRDLVFIAQANITKTEQAS